MEVLRDHHHVETGLLGEDRMADQLLGMPLLMAAEIGEALHRIILTGSPGVVQAGLGQR